MGALTGSGGMQAAGHHGGISVAGGGGARLVVSVGSLTNDACGNASSVR